jgi:hypothetical protein
VSTPLGELLDVVRVLGNDALHLDDQPGELLVLALDDTTGPELVELLLNTANDLVDELVTKPKTSRGLWDQLPEGIQARLRSLGARPQAAVSKPDHRSGSAGEAGHRRRKPGMTMDEPIESSGSAPTRAENLFEVAGRFLEDAQDAEDLPVQQNLLTLANAHFLQAIYHELRHGNGLAALRTAEQVKALTAHAKQLDDHANTMDILAQALRASTDR